MNSQPLSKRLETLVKSKRFTLAELARKSGVPKSTIAGWIAGKTPKINQLADVANALEVSFTKLALGKPDPFESESQELSELFEGDVRVTIHRIVKKRS